MIVQECAGRVRRCDVTGDGTGCYYAELCRSAQASRKGEKVAGEGVTSLAMQQVRDCARLHRRGMVRDG